MSIIFRNKTVSRWLTNKTTFCSLTNEITICIYSSNECTLDDTLLAVNEYLSFMLTYRLLTGSHETIFGMPLKYLHEALADCEKRPAGM